MGSRACKAGEGGKARETQFALYKMGFLPYFKGTYEFVVVSQESIFVKLYLFPSCQDRFSQFRSLVVFNASAL